MPDRSLVLETASPEETNRIGAALGRSLAGGEALSLIGDLGAGKTTLVKAIAAALGFEPRNVSSPTFLLIHEHRGPIRLYHVDAYRTSGAEELLEAGGLDMFAPDAVVAVEWGEKAEGLLPTDHLRIEIGIRSDSERELRFSSGGPKHDRLILELTAELDREGSK